MGGVGGARVDDLLGAGAAQRGKLRAARLAVGARHLENVNRFVGSDHGGDGGRIAGHVGVALPSVQRGRRSGAAVNVYVGGVVYGDDADILEQSVVVHGDEEVAGVFVRDNLLAHQVLSRVARDLVAGHGVVGGVHRDGFVGGDACVGEVPGGGLVRRFDAVRLSCVERDGDGGSGRNAALQRLRRDDGHRGVVFRGHDFDAVARI